MNHENFEALCPLYTLNLLDQTEKGLLEAHLQTGCTICSEILKETLETVSLLPYLLPSVEPSAALKQKLISQIQAEIEEKRPYPEHHVKRAAERTWLPLPNIPGIEVQHLWSSNGRSAMLMRSLSGSVFPPHRHRGPELVYILEGNAIFNGEYLTAGDFYASEPGSIDQHIRCEPGCVFLLISNDNNEFL